jgi:hypothetical protein
MYPSKYQNTVLYFSVYSELIQAARYQGVTTYQTIAQIMGLPMSGGHMARETGAILGEISQNEARLERPLLSAIAVGVSGEPGPGFFGLARALGRLPEEADKEAEWAFWEAEKTAVYQTWARRFDS